MKEIRFIRNDDVDRVLIGVPEGRKHLRFCMKLKDGSVLVFQEATVANILRAYTTIKTHPTVRALELKMRPLATKTLKEGFAEYQLLETSKKSEEIERKLRNLLETHSAI